MLCPGCHQLSVSLRLYVNSLCRFAISRHRQYRLVLLEYATTTGKDDLFVHAIAF